MDFHALLVHRGEPRVEIDEFRAHRSRHQMAVLELRALALDHLVLETVRGPVLRDQIEERFGKVMRVDVDRAVLVIHRGSFFRRFYRGGTAAPIING